MNNFCFHLYAQKSLFVSKNNFFLVHHTLSCDIIVHRAGYQIKIILRAHSRYRLTSSRVHSQRAFMSEVALIFEEQF